MDEDKMKNAITLAAAVCKKTVRETVFDAAKRFTRLALRSTPPLLTRNGPQKRKDHTEFLKTRILRNRLPRGKIPRRGADRSKLYMSKSEARRYYRNAVAWQGRMIAGWNALAHETDVRPVTWIRRHGEVFGTAKSVETAKNFVIRAEYRSEGSRDIEKFVPAAMRQVERGMIKNAAHILRKRRGNAEIRP